MLGSPERSLQKERDEIKKERDEFKAELRESLVREFEGNRRLLDAMTENKELHAAYQFACMSYEKVLDELEATEVLEDDLRAKIEELQWRETKLERACWDAGEELEELRPLLEEGREMELRLAAELEASEGKKLELKKQLADAELCKAGLQEVNDNLKGDMSEMAKALVDAEERQQLLQEDREAARMSEREMEGLLNGQLDLNQKYEDKIQKYEAKEQRRLAEAKEHAQATQRPEEPPQAKHRPEAEIRDRLDKAWALPEEDLGRAGETAP